MNEEENVDKREQTSKKSTSRDLKSLFNKLNKSKTGAKTLVKALSKALISCGWVILAFIIVVGIIMFLLTMPGMVMEKLKGLFKALADAWGSWWGDDSAGKFDNSEIYNVLNYLDDMGYDLKGYGFVTDYLNHTDQFDDTQDEADAKKESGLKVTADGVIRNGDNEIVTGVSDFIRAYLISENYIYTIKNNNIVTESEMVALWHHFKNLFADDMSKKSGMLAFFHDGGSIGQTSENAYDSFERGYIKFEGKNLLIKKGWTNSAMSYSLDGWTGRYGMPVDFLLTLHLATQMPDLPFDMTQSFETEVKILLHKSEGEVFGSYKGNNGYVDSNDLEKELNGLEGGNPLSWIIVNIDDWGLNEDEATALVKLGIIAEGHNPTLDGAEKTDGNCDCVVDADGAITSVGDTCKKRWKYIIKSLKRDNDFNYATYTPYIEKVTDHWFRDVYFITKADDEFVDYDYQYELITGERWSMYETDENGDFVYYKMNEDGSTSDEVYTGKVISGETILNGENGEPLRDEEGNIITERIANRGEDGTLVVKKAKTIDLADKYQDLGWNLLSNGYYSAYDTEEGSFDEYQQMYTDEELASEDKEDWQKNILKNVYTHVNIGTVTQTGDALRTETNPKIKKMFLSNKYFKYDGSRQKAEIIHALREKSGVRYGPIPEDKLEEEYELTFQKAPEGIYTSEAKDGTYKLKDYVGNVSFQQDALNTFAMLENSHTVDADYIYKDFKELVVELGYFQKEELTDAKPKLLQWVVPDIGSGGYPRRSIDKREGEFGTLVHSKMDIDANEKSTILNLLAEMAEEETLDGVNEFQDTPARGLGARMGTGNKISIDEVGAIDGETRSVTSVSIDEFLETTRAMCEYMNEEGYDYCVYVTCDGDGEQNCHHDVHGNDKCSKHTGSGCGLPTTFQASQESTAKHNVCCATLVSWALQNVKVMPDSAHQDGANSLATWILDNLEPEKIEKGQPLKPGDILCYDGHIDLVGEEVDGGFVKYNGGAYVQKGATEFGPHSCIQKITGWPNDDRLQFALRLNWGGKKDGSPYVGYEGNEAVVSPVTGILMEYGTYSEEEAEENRENIDLKYGGILEKYELETETITDPETGEQTTKIKYPSDKVGYAVIKILDAETYRKLESTVKNKWQDASASLVKVKEKSKDYSSLNKHIEFDEKTEELLADDREDKWTRLDETVYGYKEFAEQYEQFGIGGYYVYIDGFKCETVDESLVGDDDDNKSQEDKKVEPKGEALTLDSFKITPTEVENEDFEPDTTSLYEPDEVSKLVSESYTKQLEGESAIKADASIGITFSYKDIEIDEEGNTKEETNEYILIKEGTVIGRTLTDFELLESTSLRNKKLGTYDEYVEAQKVFLEEDETKPNEEPKPSDPDKEEDLVTNNVPLVGNYLRVIMQEPNGDIVENVEDYMKLDEESLNAVSQEYKAWPGDLEALAEVMVHEAGYNYLASKSHKFASDQKEADFEMYCMGYSVVNKLLEQNKQWYGHLYDAGRTDMSPLVQVVTNAKARWYGYDTSHVINKMKCYTEKELEYAEYCLTYDCTSIKKPYDTPLGSGARDDGYSKTNAGTVIPRAMCQQGGYGDGASGQSNIILVSNWDHNNNNQFDNGDELWGVDRAMESLLDKDNVTISN